MTDLPSQLAGIVGEAGVSTDRADLEYYGLDWTRFYQPAPAAIVFPQGVDEVVRLVQFAREQRIGLVPSGGRTGLSGGACALNGEIVVSLEKMNQVLAFSPADMSVTVQAGVVTAALQAYARQQGLFYPVDFAASGSSHIGGNIATNAGGIRVIRYGMTRNWVSGLKVVTGTGDVMQLNRGLLKNNTGYDLRHLFIGSEGTLGIVTEATLQLLPEPEAAGVMLLAVPGMACCIDILQTFRRAVTLNAFEFFSDAALASVIAHSALKRPFARRSAFYVLLEYEAADEQAEAAAAAAFETCAGNDLVTDAVVSRNETQQAALWQYRERISESISHRTPYKNDIAVKVSAVPGFLAAVEQLVSRSYPDFEIIWFGHIGDGNLHLNILKPDDWATADFKAACDTVSESILGLVSDFGGSVSAEHGIGLLKKHQLRFSRSEEELEALKAIKRVFDPDNIMNPGKLFTA